MTELTHTLPIVFTGGPGAGKTTALLELTRRGYRCMPDVARSIIRARLAAGDTPRPEPNVFAQQTYDAEVTNYLQATAAAASQAENPLEQRCGNQSGNRPIFFDRCVVDAIGGLLGCGVISTVTAANLNAQYRFRHQVFIFPPWREIYTTDAERDHTYAHAEQVYAAIASWYTQCGYELVEVPKISVEHRVNFVLAHCGLT